jgi:predicted dehydrogenase
MDVLCIGVGNRGRWPWEEFAKGGPFRAAALCDIAPGFLEEARARTGLGPERCFARAEDAVAAGLAPCAIVCSPTATHVPYAKLCMNAGLHVLIEKGMAPSWNEACDIVQFARGRSERLAVAQNYRYNALERTILQALRDSDSPYHPGEVYRVDYIHHRVRPEPRTLTYPFASVWDMSCHHFDNLMCWFGPVEEVSAHAYAAPWSAYPHPNNTDAHLVFASGVRVNYVHTHDAAHGSQRIEIHGRRGMLRALENQVQFGLRPTRNFGWTDLVDVPLVAAPALAGMLEDFHRYIVEGVEPGISCFRNLEVMALCELTVRSCTERRSAKRSELGNIG